MKRNKLFLSFIITIGIMYAVVASFSVGKWRPPEKLVYPEKIAAGIVMRFENLNTDSYCCIQKGWEKKSYCEAGVKKTKPIVNFVAQHLPGELLIVQYPECCYIAYNMRVNRLPKDKSPPVLAVV